MTTSLTRNQINQALSATETYLSLVNHEITLQFKNHPSLVYVYHYILESIQAYPSNRCCYSMAIQEKDIDLHVSHMTSGPVVSLCLQRENAVGRLLEVLGPCDARVAKRQSQFLLRGSFGEDSIRNAFYGRFSML